MVIGMKRGPETKMGGCPGVWKRKGQLGGKKNRTKKGGGGKGS